MAEIAAVLGVPRNHAHALLSRARGQLETSLGALLVARTGRGDCDGAGRACWMSWDGELTVLMRKRINRHIERCRGLHRPEEARAGPGAAARAGPGAALAPALPGGLRTRCSGWPAATPRRPPRPGHDDAAGRAVRPSGFPKAAGPAEGAVVAAPPRPGRGGGGGGGGGSRRALAGVALTAGSTGALRRGVGAGAWAAAWASSAEHRGGRGPLGPPGQPGGSPLPGAGRALSPSPAAAT